MRWIEGTVETNHQEIDVLCDQLTALGAESICIEDEEDFKDFLENNQQYWDYVDDSLASHYQGLSRVKFYLADAEEGRAILEQMRKSLQKEISVSYVKDEDWSNSWQQNYEPIEIGQRLIIVPDWLNPELNNRIPLRLEPGLAFGTGNHPTTQMCLKVLDGLDLKDKKVLDLGCGSGILGIAALNLGCRKVAGCDVDPKAPDAARANAALNNIEENRFEIHTGDIIKDAGLRKRLGEGYDIVIANIVADVIISLSEGVRRFMAPNGLFICSGIIEDRETEVEAALKKHGFKIREKLSQDEWRCFTVT